MVKNLSDEQRTMIKDYLLEHSTNLVVHKGKLKEAASSWNVSTRTIGTIWSRAKNLRAQGLLMNVNSKRKGKVSRPKFQIDEVRVKAIAPTDRQTHRSFAEHYGVSKTTICRWLQKGLLRAHSNAIKPDLTLENRLLRLNFSLGALIVDNILNVVKFKPMRNVVHIDEKWFHMTKCNTKFYLLPGEEPPHRSCKSKRYITKVMFMCAVARPFFGENGEVLFDGKIGTWPFTKQVPAKRSSRNRRAGTLETKASKSVTKEVFKDCLINQIIPAIKAKWPANESKHIIIQQDNAPPHISGDDEDFKKAATSDGFNIELLFQPPNSPDMNINDLGFFRAIQSLQLKSRSRNIDQLVKAVDDAFHKLEPSTLNNVFLSLQGCIIGVMKRQGKNDYLLPHMGKEALDRRGILPEVLHVDEVLVREVIEYLMALGKHVENEELMQDLNYTSMI